DSEIGGHVYDWLGQLGESPIHFLERLAERFDALFDVKDGNLIFAKRGTGQSASGAALTPIVVTRGKLLEGTGRVRFSDRFAYKSVTAKFMDREKEDRNEVEEESDPENGEAVYRIRDQFADEAEAKAAAKAKAKQLKRRQATFDCVINGDPAARAGAPLTFAVGRPGVDGLPFTIGTATHRYDKGGYVTTLSGESQDGQSSA
ncbi:MAG: contractile injection system protein, VgrG/Pvc8 family, partial [Pseudomonadota bacterium]